MATRNITKTVVIKGLPANLTQKNMEERFSSYGTITDIRFLPTKEHLEKFKTISAILSFADINSALAVVDELQHAQVFSRRITVEFNRFASVTNKSPSSFRSYEEKNRRYEPRNYETTQQRPRQPMQSSSPPSYEQTSSQSSNQSTENLSTENSSNGNNVEEHVSTMENNLEKEGNIEEIGEEISEIDLQAEDISEESVLTVDDNVDSERISEPVLTTEDIEQETATQPAFETNENSLEPGVKVQDVENIPKVQELEVESIPEIKVQEDPLPPAQEVESIPEPVPLPPAPRAGINFGISSLFK